MLIPDFVHTLIYGRAGKRLHAEASALAVFLAGAMAQNVHLDDYQCGIDKAAIGDLLDGLSVDEALATMAQARRIAAYGLKVHAKRLVKIAQRLERTGHA